MNEEKNKGGMMSVIAALGANVLVAISKFIGFAISGSAAMLNESIHSIVDCGNEILLLVGNKQAAAKCQTNTRLVRLVQNISIA